MASRNTQQINIFFAKMDLSPTADVAVRDHLTQ